MSIGIDWSRFMDDIRKIYELAEMRVTGNGDALPFVQDELAGQLDRDAAHARDTKATLERLFGTADTLYGLQSSSRLLNDGRLKECLNRADLSEGQCAELHAELLAAAWLGLYFLGAPISAPWERAQQIADEQGGYARGACTNKAIGDVYRTTRQARMREYGAPAQRGSPPAPSTRCRVEVLTRRPFALIPMTLLPLASTPVPEQVTLLGRCYGLLQFRLYVEAGYPLRYIIPESAVLATAENVRWSHGTDVDPADRIDPWHQMARWAHTIFRERRDNQDLIIEPDIGVTGGIPACLLGHSASMYGLAEAWQPEDEHDLPLSGYRISPALADAYRAKLNAVKTPPVQWTDVPSLESALKAACGRPPELATHTPTIPLDREATPEPLNLR